MKITFKPVRSVKQFEYLTFYRELIRNVTVFTFSSHTEYVKTESIVLYHKIYNIKVTYF